MKRNFVDLELTRKPDSRQTLVRVLSSSMSGLNALWKYKQTMIIIGLHAVSKFGKLLVYHKLKH